MSIEGTIVMMSLDWRYKILSNAFVISLVLFIMALCKQSWKVYRLPLLIIFIISGVLLYWLFKTIDRRFKVNEQKKRISSDQQT